MKLYNLAPVTYAEKIQSKGFFDCAQDSGYPGEGVHFLSDPFSHPDPGYGDGYFMVDFPDTDEIIKYRLYLEAAGKTVPIGWMIPADVANRYFFDKTFYDLYADYKE